MNELQRRLAPLERVIVAAAERYAELGDVRGNLRLPDLTEAERVALAGLLGEYIKAQPGSTLVFPLRRLEAVLRERGLGESLPEVVTALTGRRPVTRAEGRAAAARRWQQLLESCRPARPGRALEWHQRLCRGESSAHALLQREFNLVERGTAHSLLPLELAATPHRNRPEPDPPHPNPQGQAPTSHVHPLEPTPTLHLHPAAPALAAVHDQAGRVPGAPPGRADWQPNTPDPHRHLQWALAAVTEALDRLPVDQGRSLRLPVFASQVTGDPHAFDSDALAGRLLLRALADLLGQGCGVPHPAEDAIERGILLTASGLLPDGISSTVACFGLREARRSDGAVDEQVAAAWSERSVLTTTLRQVGHWSALEVGGTILYAVENPPVYEELVDALTQAGIRQPIICTSGFLSVAAYRLLDLAAAGGATIAYGGDFDPNGLTIAARLLDRYGSRLRLWGMGVDDYRAASDHPKARPFDEAARRKLEGFESTPLAPLAKAMLECNRSGYQEALLDRLAAELLQ